MKIDIPTLLVHLRARIVDADRGHVTAWGAAMKAASLVMSNARRFTIAQKAAGVGRVLFGRKGRISSLPFPGSLWTGARDLPAPPKQTFRQWWVDEHASAVSKKEDR